jgi:hypothetical protein
MSNKGGKIVPVRFDAGLLGEAEGAAREAGQKLSEWIREAVRGVLDKTPQRAPTKEGKSAVEIQHEHGLTEPPVADQEAAVVEVAGVPEGRDPASLTIGPWPERVRGPGGLTGRPIYQPPEKKK